MDLSYNTVHGNYGATVGVNAVFTPTSTLTGGTLYSVAVCGNVKDLAGNTLSGNYNYSFTTAAEGWGTASTLAAPGSTSFGPYSLVTDAQGHVSVIYGVGQLAKAAFDINGNAMVVWSGLTAPSCLGALMQ